MRRTLPILALAGCLLTATPAPAAELPLGPRGLAEERSVAAVAPGVRLETIVRGSRAAADVFTVDVAFLGDRDAARAELDRLRAAGYRDARIRRVRERADDDRARGPLGFQVRTGAFATEAEAVALRDRLAAEGRTGLRVVFTGEDGGPTTGPWVVRVLSVDPARFGGTVAPVLGTGIVPGNELLTGIASRTGALAAINGGYFTIGPADGTPGDLAGISELEGELVSEAVDGRTSLVLGEERASIAALRTRARAVAGDGAVRELDGFNRLPGLIRGCGGTGGDRPTERPLHDFTCTDDSELIRFTPVFGASTPPGEGAEVVLDARDRVIELRARGGAIPPGGSVIAGTGEAEAWLRAHAAIGSRLCVHERLSALDAPLAPRPRAGIVNGGPRLLRAGRRAIPAVAEGFVRAEDPGFFYRFGVRRNPRTLAGVARDGRLLLVAIDGRRPGESVGASFAESAAVLRSLGARDGVNLDGGGSTAITRGATLLNRPSDLTGERPIGDAIVLQP